MDFELDLGRLTKASSKTGVFLQVNIKTKA